MRQHAPPCDRYARPLPRVRCPAPQSPSLPGTRAAEIAEKVGTQPRQTHRSGPHAGASSPERTTTPAATHRATTHAGKARKAPNRDPPSARAGFHTRTVPRAATSSKGEALGSISPSPAGSPS
jgi:hypothetical protein